MDQRARRMGCTAGKNAAEPPAAAPPAAPAAPRARAAGEKVYELGSARKVCQLWRLPPGQTGVTYGKMRWGAEGAQRMGHCVILVAPDSILRDAVAPGDQIVAVDNVLTLHYDQQQLGDTLMARAADEGRRIAVLRESATEAHYPPLAEYIAIAKARANDPAVTKRPRPPPDDDGDDAVDARNIIVF